MKGKAFTLIELVVYLSVLSIFSLLSFNYLLEFSKKFLMEMHENKELIRSSIILDIIRRDLMCAKASIKYWDSKHFIFRKNSFENRSKDVSWQVREDGVYRISGIYDFNKKKWIKKNVAKLNFNFHIFNFFIYQNKNTGAVEKIAIEFDKEEIIVCLRNKKLIL